ncbi:MAG: DnaJ domain-containing protein [Leptolyngbyaceae cyanobacterium MO_188.B28]|nr:DnaJ domain-containing protein [Leptolyngbyaceae cyanobacterium MO_188.B28]
MKNLTQHFKVLGLEPGTSEAEIERSYRKLAKIWHPKNFLDDPRRRHEAEKKIKALNIAHDTLIAYFNRQGQVFQHQSNHSPSQPDPIDLLNREITAKACFEQGGRWLREGNYKEAIGCFSQAIRLNPNYLDAYRARAFSLEQLGYLNRANDDFNKVAALKQKAKRPPSKNSAPTFQAPEQPEAAAKITSTYPEQTLKQPEAISPIHAASQPPITFPLKSLWECAHTFIGHTEVVTSVALSRDGRMLVSGSFDKTVKLWSVNSGQLLSTVTGHSREVNCVAFSPNSKLFASGSGDKTIKVWEVVSGRLICTLGGPFSGHSEEVKTLAFSPDGQILISGAADKTIRLWRLSTGKEICTLKGQAGPIFSLAVSWDGKIFACGGREKHLRIRQLEDGKLIRSLQGESRYVLSVALSQDGTLLAAGGLLHIELWDLIRGEKIATLQGHADTVRSLAFSADGETLVSGGYDGAVKLWDPNTGNRIDTLKGHQGPVSSVAHSLTSPTIVSGSADRTIKLWRRIRPDFSPQAAILPES